MIHIVIPPAMNNNSSKSYWFIVFNWGICHFAACHMYDWWRVREIIKSSDSKLTNHSDFIIWKLMNLRQLIIIIQKSRYTPAYIIYSKKIDKPSLLTSTSAWYTYLLFGNGWESWLVPKRFPWGRNAQNVTGIWAPTHTDWFINEWHPPLPGSNFCCAKNNPPLVYSFQ